MQLSQSTHRQTFLDQLVEDIRGKAADESLPFPTASTRVVLEWLGYELDDISFIDTQDRGVDAWQATGSGFDIFQIKTHELKDGLALDLHAFDGSGVRDIERAKNFFIHESDSGVSQKGLKLLLNRRDSALRSHKLEGSTGALHITLHLIVLGDDLTTQAKAEFKAFQASNATPIMIDDVPLQILVVLHTVDHIIDGKWREKNRDWVDLRGRRYDRINLRSGSEGAISDNANAIFYCKAIDLVNAYDTLGYQLFEPNVRANIKNSRVNQAIRESVLYQRSRREFRFLNNGVTITCDSFSKPNSQRPHFTVVHPGVVNGLQTVVALHAAYQQLAPRDKEDFEQNCAVMVRLLVNTAVEDITRVVRATNNQNPMKPRNLVSNNPEQLIYARIFAEELNWFYEAKEGAWDAFDKDPKRWRPALNKKPKDFRPERRTVRKIDNADLSQTWLAFIGFSSEAVNDKKALFDDRFYPLIFKQQTRKHGVDYDFSLARAREDTIDQSPNPSLMLVSYLSWSFANDAAPNASKNRQEACKRLGIDPDRMSKAELDARLSNDSKFLLNQALANMSLLFTEFTGYLLYKSLETTIHHSGSKVLSNYSFTELSKQFDTEVPIEKITNGSYGDRDLLVIMWLVFTETIDDMINRGWGASYRAAPVKSRFIFSRETRDRLYREIEQTNEFMKKRSLKKPWAVGVSEGQSLFDFIHSCLDK